MSADALAFGILFAYLCGTFVCSWIASEKNRSGAGHWIGAILFSPPFWLLVLIALPTLAPRRLMSERVDPADLAF
jgi:apolipoprotein N-acyltransferase